MTAGGGGGGILGLWRVGVPGKGGSEGVDCKGGRDTNTFLYTNNSDINLNFRNLIIVSKA